MHKNGIFLQSFTFMGQYSLLTDASLAAIGETCKGLISIYIERVITDLGMELLTLGCNRLQSINIGRCSKLTDASLAVIGQSCNRLTSIDISPIAMCTDAGMALLTQGCSHFKSVKFTGDGQQRDASVAAIGESWKGLISIDMGPNSDVTHADTGFLTQGCNHLQSVDISCCRLLTDSSLRSMGESSCGLHLLAAMEDCVCRIE